MGVEAAVGPHRELSPGPAVAHPPHRLTQEVGGATGGVGPALAQPGHQHLAGAGGNGQQRVIAAGALRHAGASRVLVELDFGQDELRLSVSDDGVGLPDDYEERGHGFENMRTYAERLGGRLVVEPRGSVGGASVTCVMPLARGEQEG